MDLQIDLQLASQALKKYFGYDKFRPMQEEIIQSIYDKKDTVVLMPTGGGKSICFQIPALTLKGTCLVVSPLISLMKDQVSGLVNLGIKAAYLNSSLAAPEARHVENELFNGNLDLIYVSPEKLLSNSFFPLLENANISLFAIDEAHCISSWGHDFRPEYTKMKFLKQQFPDIPIVALTATADKLTRKDITTQMGMNNPNVFVASFDRPNLSLEVRPGQKRIEQIIEFIKDRPGESGIVYCLSRKNTEDVAAKLQGKGIKAMCYHAGMPTKARHEVQEDFINDNIKVVCATVAFGMGIDKSNVRFVVHYNLPQNMESYYQEIGRAGRDGVSADTLMFYSYRDVMVYRDILTKEESKNTEVKLAKLERIQQYADAMSCRRKILLNYFSETLEEDCGNCDICKNPPSYLDGTVIVQKALSAIARMKERVGIRMLIDVLRGSGRREVFEQGFNNIKTYGAGRDFSQGEWQYFIQQMINLGYFDIAYDQNNNLKLTPASKEVLFDGKKVNLVRLQSRKEKEAADKIKLKPRSQKQVVQDELFEVLRALRKKIAIEFGIPPYLVFNDATLKDMSDKKPTNDAEMLKVSGVAEKKLKQYGYRFINAILEFIIEKSKAGVKIQGTTRVISYALFQQGYTVKEIAAERELHTKTIYSHLADSYENGADIDISSFITEPEIKHIATVVSKLPMPMKLKDIYVALNEQVDYYKIKFALAHMGRE